MLPSLSARAVDGNYGAGAGLHPFAIHVALFCTIVATCISCISVWLHWKNYRKPNQQRQVIRILWMVPIYGISTYISLVSLDVAFYVDTFRDIYEAFVIYAFFNLLLNKLGGERALIIMLHSRPPSENFFPGTLWSREIYVGDPYTFLFVKRGILQFVYVKPILAVLTMILKATGNYQDGEISWSSSYLYITFFYNLSVCLSLWCLMVFFYATKKDLVGFRPLPKFLCVKAIIFFSFWQSVIIALLVWAGFIPEDEGSEHISVAIQDFLICLEMIPAAIAHSFSFSYEDYYDRSVHSARMPVMRAIKDSFGLKDVAMDTLDTLRGSRFNYRSFEPSEGVPHIGSSRTSRIMAGLRYSTSTAKKHWLEPAPVSRYLNAGPGTNGERVVEEVEPLEFEDPNPWDEVEALYESSRTMIFGDYNYPVIDFRAPLWRQVRYPASGLGSSSSSTRSRGYGGTGNTVRTDLGGTQPDSARKKDARAMKGSINSPREGCVDLIVEQGKGNYVLVTDNEPQTNLSTTPSSPVQNRMAPPHHLRPSRSTPQPSPPTLKSSSDITAVTVSHIPTSREHNQTPPRPHPSFSSPPQGSSPPSVPDSNTYRAIRFPNEMSWDPPDFDEEEDALLTGNVWR